MNRRATIILLILCSALMAWLASWRRGAPEREIARLVRHLDFGENYLTNSHLRNLVIQNSTQAVEHALRLIRRKDPSWKKLATEFDRKIASINLAWDQESDRGIRASKVFFVVGSKASNFVAAFSQLIENDNAFHGQLALIFVGAQALPTVTNLFLHREERVRADAAFAYNKIKGNRSFTTQWTESGAGKTIYAPTLTLSDDDVYGLAQMLTNNNLAMRRAAAEALERHSGIGRVAIPALREALSDSDSLVRSAAKDALNAIAPGSAP